VNEFNIDTNVASIDDTDENTIFNSIVIPNENNDVNNFFGAVVHKGKKFNYVCDINPCTISSISGRVTNLNGQPAYHGITPNNHTHTYALLGITGWGVTSGNLLSGTTIGTLTVGGVNQYAGTSAEGTVLVDSQVGSTVIIFSSSIPLTTADFDAQTSITLNNYNLTSTSFFLRESNGCRMVAEFTIESFD
jgi:hypothetical protein